MSDRSVVRGGGADEREWRKQVEGRLSTEHDCTERASELAASRREFAERPTAGGSSRRKWAVRALVVVAIPLIVYSEFVAPSGGINYSGLGIGVVLMLAGWLVYL